MIAPHRIRRTIEGRVDALVIVPGDFPTDPSFQFPQCHTRSRGRLIAASVGGIAECRARKHLHGAHLRTNQPFDMPAEMRLAYGTPLDLDPVVSASSLKSSAAKIGTIVGMQRFRKTGDRPGRFNVPLR
jgi:hypothetical protein